MAVRRSLVVGLGLALLAPLAGSGVSTAAPTADPVVTKAVTWLESQQQTDGSFEVAGFPGFETSDVVLALAEGGQTENAWNEVSAKAGVESIQTNGKDALDALDDLVDTGDTTTVAAAARAAKVVALVANPLGILATDFDPSNDTDAGGADLIARVKVHVDEAGQLELPFQFNGVAYAAIAFAESGTPEPTGIAAQIKAAQRSDGSWNYAGTTEATDPAPPDGPIAGDVDTTAVALLALKDLGFDRTDPVVAKGVTYLAAQQQASGAWQSFGSNDPNSTSSAVVALSALHLDVDTAAWRTGFGGSATGFASPYAYLRGLQAVDGHIPSPNDFGAPNTFATSQTTEALARQWFLSSEFSHLVNALSATLGSPAASPSTAAADLASDTLGANPSIASKRLAAATAVVNSQLGRNAAAADLFVQGLGRTIDPSGRAYWSNKLLTIKRPQMLSRLTGSSEFFRKNGATSAGFVSAVYLRVLGRAADASGKAYWVKKINKGDSVLHVAQSLVASSEYKRHEVRDAYVRVLDRQPTAGESTAGQAVVAGSRVEALLAQLGGSLERYEMGQDN